MILGCVNLVNMESFTNYPFSSSVSKTTAPLELIFSDIWGPSPIASTNGHKYYIVFVDSYTRFSWMFPLTLKSKALSTFISFQKQVELQFNTRIKTFQSDMGKEYQVFGSFLKSLGIVHRFSCPYTHQQNGVAERKHRHIVETGLTLLAHASLPLKFWCEAFLAITLLINNLPTPVLHGKSPFECIYHKPPNYSYLKVFGCACFPYLRPYSKTKFGYHTSKCIFIGYIPQYKGYKCLSSSGWIYISRNVLFHEFDFS
ncbi:hypothetical protein ACOSQ4_021466 [Xanthoceras sorbifolium]